MKVNTTRKIIGSLVLTLLLGLVAAVGLAQERGKEGKHGDHMGRGMEGGFGHFGRDLNLTDSQKTAMKAIADKYAPAIKGLHEQLRNSHNKAYDPFTGAPFDDAAKAAVRTQVLNRAGAEADLAVVHTQMMSEMFGVLTDAQKAQLAQKRQEHEQRHKQQEGAEDNQ